MKKLGFTLAEVLITLVIIGVIAAMTVPTLMNNTNAQEFRSGLKKAISGVNQALTLHYALEGTTAQDMSNGAELVSKIFKKRMSVLDANSSDLVIDGASCEANASFITADGVIFCVTNFASAHDDAPNTSCSADNQTPCNSGKDVQTYG